MPARPGPEHVCALIRDPNGRLVFEARPAGARRAAGRLVCFGGKRRPGETGIAALRRELAEELGWAGRPGPVHCDLVAGERWIARFYVLRQALAARHCHPGHALRHLSLRHCQHPRISRWHRLVLAAWRGGRRRVDLLQR